MVTKEVQVKPDSPVMESFGKKFVYMVRTNSTASKLNYEIGLYDDFESAKKFANEYIKDLIKYQNPYDVNVFMDNKQNIDNSYDVGVVFLKGRVEKIFIERYALNHNVFDDEWSR